MWAKTFTRSADCRVISIFYFYDFTVYSHPQRIYMSVDASLVLLVSCWSSKYVTTVVNGQ